MNMKATRRLLDLVTHQVGRSNLFNCFCFICFRIDGTVVGDGVDFFAFRSNLGDCVRFLVLETFDELVDNIYEDNLQSLLVHHSVFVCRQFHFESRQRKLLGDKAATNVPATEVDCFETHT